MSNELTTLKAENDALRGLVRRLAGWLYVSTAGHTYGYFPGGDPRDFRPDEECCTPAEIAAWEADCAKWNAGQQEPTPPAGVWSDDGAIHILAPRYGLGSYVFRDPDIEAIIAVAERMAGPKIEPEGEA